MDWLRCGMNSTSRVVVVGIVVARPPSVIVMRLRGVLNGCDMRQFPGGLPRGHYRKRHGGHRRVVAVENLVPPSSRTLRSPLPDMLHTLSSKDSFMVARSGSSPP